MTKKIAAIVLVLVLCAAWLVPAAQAADAKKPKGRAQEPADSSDQVTQGELAEILVNMLGLGRFLPAAPTTFDFIKLCLNNRMSPAAGWEPDKPVTRADLARVIVQAMQMAEEVESPDDPKSWVALLRSLGVSLDTIGEATDQVQPLVEPVAANVYVVATTTDPLKKRKTGEPDETEFGTDVEFVASMRPLEYPVTIAEVQAVVAQVQRRGGKGGRRHVTPD